jgi:hypothetical protein
MSKVNTYFSLLISRVRRVSLDNRAKKAKQASLAWKACLDPRVTRETPDLREPEDSREIAERWGETDFH